MADATATFLLTARDATGAAIASANKNLTSLQRSVSSVRRLLGGFGVALSAQAFSSWIRGATDVNKLTEDQKKHLEGTLKAMGDLRSASDQLAQSLAMSLTPAMETVAKLAIGLNSALFKASPFPFEQQINQLRPTVDFLRASIDAIKRGNPYDPQLDALTKQYEELNAQLEMYMQRQRDALGLSPTKGEAKDVGELREITIRSLEEIRAAREAMGLRSLPEDLGLGSRDLNSLLELKEITIRSLDEIRQARDNLGLLPLPELPDGSELQALFQPMEKEANEFAAMFGGSLKDMAVDAFSGIERSWGEMLRRMAVEVLVSNLFSGLATTFGGPATFLGQLFGGFRANGGPTQPGKGYIVGERGPEFFFPGTSGMVAPAVAGSGDGVTIVQHNDFRGVDPSAIGRIGQALERNKQETLAEVRNLRNRGRL